MPFTHSVRVRYGEVDMQGVVFNANWLSYFDDASTRFFEDCGAPLEWTGPGALDLDLMVVKAVVEWGGSARFDDTIDISVSAVRLGNSSFDLLYEASVGAQPVCRGTITYVCIDGTKRSVPLPDDLRAALTSGADGP